MQRSDTGIITHTHTSTPLCDFFNNTLHPPAAVAGDKITANIFDLFFSFRRKASDEICVHLQVCDEPQLEKKSYRKINYKLIFIILDIFFVVLHYIQFYLYFINTGPKTSSVVNQGYHRTSIYLCLCFSVVHSAQKHILHHVS